MLSILVPTLACRDHYFAKLSAFLSQFDIPVLSLRDDGDETTGAKRNRLLEVASTKYVAFIDDDDLISERYVPLVREALNGSPDIVGFKLKLYEDGVLAGTVVHSFSHRDLGAIRHRTPTHLNPIKREIALAVGFPDQNCGEDVMYATRLAQMFQNLNETFIDEELYLYFRRNDLRHERHNMNP